MSAQGVIATNRFGLGAKVGDIETASKNPKRWLLAQLEGPYREPDEFRGLLSSTEIRAAHWHRYGEASPTLNKKLEAAQSAGDKKAQEAAAADVQRMLGGYVGWATQIAHTEFGARTRQSITTTEPFRDRLTRFWSNHLVVPTAKVPATILVGAYEREVIRPHVTGRFADMLTASAKHAAMLTFLDNDTSIGPNSAFGKQMQMGLNENLGREILELHTMGVDGGYVQADVLALAKALTGWNTAPAILRAKTSYASAIPMTQRAPDGPYAFAFYPDWHEPGVFTLLGKAYAQTGVDQAEEMLNDLARHPATARYLAEKLARHFVADEPSSALVKRLADAYLANDTSLGEMTRALVDSEDAWALQKRKLKQPEDYVISALRAVGVKVASTSPYPAYRFDTYRRGAAAANAMMADQQDAGSSNMMSGGEVKPTKLYEDLAGMGQKPYGAPGPQGWYDRTSDWAGAASLVKRIEWANALAETHADTAAEPAMFVDHVLGALASDDLRGAVTRAATRQQSVALVLASAEFQRR